ncbi:MAG: glycine cleavage system protein T [[Chlorobium] sp. 445]|nr:MAG: glycine cleavage system protein T [[Chlorobium] sp. 445]
MKHTPLYHIHCKLGAKLIEFGGYEMPVQYSSIIEEHHTVRCAVGLFDVSHMGKFELKGSGAQDFLQEMLSNDVAALIPERAQYNVMLYENHSEIPDGGIIDDLIVYCVSPVHYLLIVNASNTQKDFAWLNAHLPNNLTLTDCSDELTLLALQGKHAEQTLQKLTRLNLSQVRYYGFVYGKVAGVEMYVARTGYTGEDGFEICCPNEFAEELWNGLLEAGKEFGIKPIGLGARDTLRLEMGYALYGHEIDETTNPIEAGLGWITKLNKPSFKGKEACLKAKANPKRKLVGFEMSGRAIARQGFEITTQSGERIGKVCSGTLSPTLNKPIGTGYVALEYSEPNSLIYITVREKREEARVAALPFLSKERRQAAYNAEKISKTFS